MTEDCYEVSWYCKSCKLRCDHSYQAWGLLQSHQRYHFLRGNLHTHILVFFKCWICGFGTWDRADIIRSLSLFYQAWGLLWGHAFTRYFGIKNPQKNIDHKMRHFGGLKPSMT